MTELHTVLSHFLEHQGHSHYELEYAKKELDLSNPSHRKIKKRIKKFENQLKKLTICIRDSNILEESKEEI